MDGYSTILLKASLSYKVFKAWGHVYRMGIRPYRYMVVIKHSNNWIPIQPTEGVVSHQQTKHDKTMKTSCLYQESWLKSTIIVKVGLPKRYSDTKAHKVQGPLKCENFEVNCCLFSFIALGRNLTYASECLL